MDRGTARTFVSLKIEDVNLERFTEAQYNSALDLAEEQFALDTRCLQKETTLTAVADQAYIDLPTDFMVCVLVRHKGLKLQPVNRWKLSFQNGEDWTDDVGTPTGYYIDDENERIYFYPIPQTGDAGAYVTLDYIATPTAISDDATVLLNARALLAIYHPAVVAYAAWQMLSYGPMDQSTLIKRSELMKEYEIYRDRAIDTYNNMADEPIQMKGGRNWQDRAISNDDNAFNS